MGNLENHRRLSASVYGSLPHPGANESVFLSLQNEGDPMCRAIVENLLSGTKACFKATRNLVFNQKAERNTMNRQKSRAIVENVLSGTKACFKATRNLVFNQKTERSTMNRQKSRGLVENVLSGMKAGFKSILNIFKHPKRESRMFNQKSSSTLITTLLALILGASVFMAGQVWAAEMVKDPSTGKMVTAPEYGGTLTLPYNQKDLAPIDPFYDGGRPAWWISGVNDKLAHMGNWAIDRDEFGFNSGFFPLDVMTGNLVESWETPDPLTIVFHIRKGVHWQDKPPMNGRALTAQDVEFTFRRIKGWGKEGEPLQQFDIFRMPVESITATDKWTVVVKMEEPSLEAVPSFASGTMAFILPPEVIEQHGDYRDWRNVVGTGPFMLTDVVEGVSMTRTKNPDYWGHDEKYPENRLPYVDEVRSLFMGDEATLLAALRSGQIDMLHYYGGTTIGSMDTVRSLQRTNPELQLGQIWVANVSAAAMNIRKPPFDDIRVRQAMQMALDLETINETYYGGFANTTPKGVMGHELTGFYVPFEEWPEELKKTYRYDPEGAEALLDAAGYPRGADGVRFKTSYVLRNVFDIGIIEVLAGYWDAIGVKVEITPVDTPTKFALLTDRSYEMGTLGGGSSVSPSVIVGWYSWVAKDTTAEVAGGGSPEADAAHDGFFAATTV